MIEVEQPETSVSRKDDHRPLGDENDAHRSIDQTEPDRSYAIHGTEENSADKQLYKDFSVHGSSSL